MRTTNLEEPAETGEMHGSGEASGEDLMPIGTLSRRSGVSIKTIRFYSDQGLLPPRRVTSSRYRLYDAASEVRLELIRTLRRLDFDLETIGQMLDRSRSLDDTLRLQLDALDADLRRLRRARAIVARAVDSAGRDHDDGSHLETLRRLHAVSVLDRCERAALLGASLDRHLEGVPVDASWRAWLHRTAFADLPVELDDDQWQALLELAELVDDDEFGRRLAADAKPFWRAAAPRFDHQTWQATMGSLVDDATSAIDSGEPVHGEVARRLAGRLVEAFASVQGRAADADFEREMLAQITRQDPRAERFWTLVGRLRGQPGPSPTARAFAWLHEALARRNAFGEEP